MPLGSVLSPELSPMLVKYTVFNTSLQREVIVELLSTVSNHHANDLRYP